MRRVILVGSIAAIASVAGGHVAGAAPPGEPVIIVAHTDFTMDVSAFDSDIEGCTSGTVINGDGGPHFTPWGGTFAGLKEFTCADGNPDSQSA